MPPPKGMAWCGMGGPIMPPIGGLIPEGMSVAACARGQEHYTHSQPDRLTSHLRPHASGHVCGCRRGQAGMCVRACKDRKLTAAICSCSAGHTIHLKPHCAA
eukprot:scaffold94919_cov21-Tisochrysis_lutea.AAC.2